MKKSMSRVMYLFVALFVVVGLFAGCNATPTASPSASPSAEAQATPTPTPESNLADEQVLKSFLNNEPSTLDPWQNMSGEAQNLVTAIHEPLLRTAGESGFDWEPGLATDFQANADMTEFTITLRQDAKWSDGTPITADDVVYSFQRVLDPALASERAYIYYLIKNAEAINAGEKDMSELGVVAVDASTIKFTTEQPCDYFDQFLRSSGSAPVQKAAAEQHKDLYGSDVDKLVASGPFKLDEWVHDNSVVLVKNENYWDAANVTLERIEFTITTDSNTLIGMYQTGDLDVLKVANDQVDAYKDAPNFKQSPRLKVSFIEFNPRNEFLGNVKIREALSIAFDRQAYATNIVKNPELAAYGLVPFGVKGLDGGDFREQQGNLVIDSATDPTAVDRAKTLLNEGLAELGKTVEDLQKGFVVQSLASDSAKLQAQTIQAMWKQNLGIDMPVQPMEIGVLLPMLIEGTFDCVIGGGQDSDYADPAGFMNFIYAEGKWDDAQFLALMEKVKTQTGDERIATWMEIEALVLQNFIYIPQVYAVNNWAISDHVQGLNIWSFGYEFDYKYVSITK